VPSGFKSLGVTGGDGHVYTGSAQNVVSTVTSLDYNFNNLGYVLITNSPVSDTNYTPDPFYPNWIYEVWYEVTVKLSAFGTAGFGRPDVLYANASPSKTGHNRENLNEVPCAPVDTYTYAWSNGGTTQIINANAYGNYIVTVTSPNGCTATASINVLCLPKAGNDETQSSSIDVGMTKKDVAVSNYPNPFSNKTVVMFTLPQDDHARLEVYDLAGKRLATLFDNFAKGEMEYKLEFDAGMLPTGIYIYKLTRNEDVFTGKMILSK
jgi:hypothetical protein